MVLRALLYIRRGVDFFLSVIGRFLEDRSYSIIVE